ncbi:histidine kinase, partial [Campylobacter concisus]|uniref:histidine kinase n=1 Tax=Campylobacter concisus TaxID=199 RepID=UPI000CD8B3A6
MRVNKFLVLLPIFLATFACFYGGVLYFDKFRISYNINNEITRENLIRSAIDYIISERKAYERYSQTMLPQDEITLRKANTAKNLVVKSLSNSLSNTPYDMRMRDRLNEVLKNANASWESFNLSFYSFVELANPTITSGQVAFKDLTIDADIKRYIISLIRTYDLLQNVNTAKEHILAVLMGKEKITEGSLKQTLNGLKYNDINANLLPNGEIKDNITKEIDRLDNIETTQGYDELRFKLKLKNELTRDEILQINKFENNRADLFRKIANTLTKELKRLNDNFRIKALSLAFLMFLLSLWLFYAGYKTYIWLKDLENLNQKIRLVRDEILKEGDRNPQKLIENFIALYKELLQKYEQEKSFTAIKDRLLVRLSKKFYQAKEQIFSSVATLKKDENMVKNELVFENLEKNSQIIAINYSNIKGLLDSKNGEISLNLKPFNPQILFSNILEAQIPFTQEKKLNFLTYLDANISDELEGDSEKISVVFGSIMQAVVTKCDKFANLIVEIKNVSDALSQSGLLFIETKIRTNQIFINEEQIKALNAEDENEINDEESEFYLRLASFYLKLFNSSLDISTLGGAGNEFKFILSLKKVQKLQNFSLNHELRIAYLPDINAKYNEFFAATLEDMGLRFQNIISNNQAQAKNYDIVFARQSASKNINIKNAILLKDPLTPLSVARLVYMEKNRGESLAEEKVLFLLCDKNPLSLEMFSRAFSFLDCEVIGVSSHKELKQALLLNRFNAVFIDASFFENGMANFVKEIRSLQEEKLNLVAVVSNTSNIPERELLPAFDEKIRKPFSKDELNQILPKFIKNYKPSKENRYFSKNENIVIYKSTKLENKIFAGALGEFQNTLEIANSFSELLIKIKTKPCSLALVDEAAEGFDIKELLATISELRAGLKLDARVLLFSNNLELKNQKEYIKILSPSVSK